MKKFMLVLVVLALGTFAMAQIGAPTGDVLGAHLNYGRGCAACHAPHSGQAGNGAAHTPDHRKLLPLGPGHHTPCWERPSPSAATPLKFCLPALAAGTPDVSGLLMCLSCHDGNYATGAMMKNVVYENVAVTGNYGPNPIPTLMGNEGGLGVGNYLANHPVGLNATVSCGGSYNWDCTETNGTISMNGTNSAQFVKNYGFFVSLSAYNNTAVVICTSCHNQHLMNIVSSPTARSPVCRLATTRRCSSSAHPTTARTAPTLRRTRTLSSAASATVAKRTSRTAAPPSRPRSKFCCLTRGREVLSPLLLLVCQRGIMKYQFSACALLFVALSPRFSPARHLPCPNKVLHGRRNGSDAGGG